MSTRPACVPKRSYHRFDFTVAADTGRDGLYRQQSGGGFERFQEIWLHHRALCRGRAEEDRVRGGVIIR